MQPRQTSPVHPRRVLALARSTLPAPCLAEPPHPTTLPGKLSRAPDPPPAHNHPHLYTEYRKRRKKPIPSAQRLANAYRSHGASPPALPTHPKWERRKRQDRQTRPPWRPKPPHRASPVRIPDSRDREKFHPSRLLSLGRHTGTLTLSPHRRILSTTPCFA